MAAGGTVIGNNPPATNIVAGEVVTTYKTDVAGNPDVSFKYLNYVDTSSQAREYIYNNNRARFSQSRLTEGDVIDGRDMANEQVIRSFQKRLYIALSGPEYVLFEAGEAALKYFVDNMIVSIDKAAGSVTLQLTPPYVTQLREIQATMKVTFSTSS